METGTIIKQRKTGVKLSFDFGEDKLTRTVADYSGENQFSVFYEAIDIENASTTTVKSIRLYRKILGVLIVLTAASIALAQVNKAASGFLLLCLLLLIAIVVMGMLFKPLIIKYTILQIPGKTGINTVRIIHDNNHDIILQEIKTRWATRLRKLHSAINFANDPNKEAQKFRWLKDHAVITELEYQDAITTLKTAMELPSGENPKVATENKNFMN